MLLMDGPHTNWSVPDRLEVHREEVEVSPSAEIGSCCFRVVHGVFQNFK